MVAVSAGAPSRCVRTEAADRRPGAARPATRFAGPRVGIDSSDISRPSRSFWIVATDGCPQKAGLHRVAPCCRFLWWHFDESGRCHPADAAHFGEIVPDDRPVCFVVHGSFVTMDQLVQDAVFATRWLRCGSGGTSTELVFFHWPSAGVTTLIPGRPLTAIAPAIDVVELGKRADRNGAYLRQLLVGSARGRHVGLIGHSYGCRVIAAALQGLSRCACGPGAVCDGPSRVRVVFAAAAVEHDWLNPGKRFGGALDCVDGVVNLRNRHDPILKLFPLRYPFASRALGVSGFTARDRRVNGVRSARMLELDVSHLIGARHAWWSYYTQPGIADSVARWILFAEER
ncbi:MAG: hypothetical protein D6725_01070 [Planctomycetota bacterium]|nr:MAG: hypothetical protein D6725_01070 [Planctomycetota bacterium]